MQKTWILTVALLMSLGACGGGDPSPVEACEDLSRISCNRVYECFTATQIAAAGLPATEAECVTEQVADADCANATAADACGTNETYHPDKIDGCFSALRASSCDAFLAGDFPACDAVCTAN